MVAPVLEEGEAARLMSDCDDERGQPRVKFSGGERHGEGGMLAIFD